MPTSANEASGWEQYLYCRALRTSWLLYNWRIFLTHYFGGFLPPDDSQISAVIFTRIIFSNKLFVPRHHSPFSPNFFLYVKINYSGDSYVGHELMLKKVKKEGIKQQQWQETFPQPATSLALILSRWRFLRAVGGLVGGSWPTTVTAGTATWGPCASRPTIWHSESNNVLNQFLHLKGLCHELNIFKAYNNK